VATLRSLAGTVQALVRRATEDSVPDGAAAVTYWVVLSIAPLALAAAALLGSLDTIFGEGTADDVRAQIVSFLERTVGSTDATASLLQTVTDLLSTPRTGIALASLLLALWGVRRAFAAFFRALGVVARQPKLGRGLAGQVGAVGLGLATIGVAALAALQFGAGPLFGWSTGWASGAVETLLEVWAWLRFPVLGAIVVGWMALVLAFGTPRTWRRSLPGALLTTVLWLLGAVGFRFYVQLVGDANAALGVLGGVVIALTWLYLQTLAVLYGAELNAVLWEQRTAPAAAAGRADEPAAASAPARPSPPAARASSLAAASGVALLGAAVLRRR
jgi:membrane protein